MLFALPQSSLTLAGGGSAGSVVVVEEVVFGQARRTQQDDTVGEHVPDAGLSVSCSMVRFRLDRAARALRIWPWLRFVAMTAVGRGA